jgi:hypothetical protein
MGKTEENVIDFDDYEARDAAREAARTADDDGEALAAYKGAHAAWREGKRAERRAELEAAAAD